jgi:Flp pilus assembly protein TadD
MLSTRFVAAVAIASFALAPRAADAPRCTLPNAGDWHEYRSKHFVVDTDVARFKAEMLVSRLEKMHALVVAALVGEQVEIPGRVRVIALSDPARFRELAGASHVAAYFGRSRTGEPTIVLPVAGVEADAEVVAHELAHHVSWYLFPRQPLWFSEGLAGFVETVASQEAPRDAPLGSHIGDRAAPAASAGAVSLAMAQAVHEARPFAAKELFEWRRSADDDRLGSLHAWSWLLYHWLWNTRSKQFTDYCNRLSNAEDPARAWRSAFPELDPARPGALAELESAIARYRRDGRYGYYRVSAAFDATSTEASLRPADVHLLLLAAPRRWRGERDAALFRAELDEALREDPSQPLAIRWRAELDKSSPVVALRAAVAARPTDARAWLQLAAGLGDAGDPAEREAAYRKAVALDPDDARAQNGLAWLLASQGKAREALPFANRAVDLAPWNASIVDTLAVVAMKLGQCNQALQLERRSVEAVERVEGAIPDELRKRLAEYEGRCGGAETAKAP